jgi:hypothetical protein
MLGSVELVYWRRRAVAVAAVLGLVLLVIWAVSGPSQPPTPQAGAETNTAGSTQLSFTQPGQAGEPVGGPSQAALPGAGLPPLADAEQGLPAQPGPSTLPSSPALPSSSVMPSASALPSQSVVPSVLPAPMAGQPRAAASYPSGAGLSQAAPAGQRPGPAPAAGAPTVLAPKPVDEQPAASAPAAPTGAAPGAPRNGAIPAAPAPATARPGVAPAAPAPATARPGAAPAAPARNGAAPAPAPGPAAAPAPAMQCADQNIAVVAQVGAPNYKVGDRPLFRLVVANLGDKPCSRDLDPGLRGLVVTGPGGQLWADNDCNPERHSEVRVLEPGKPLVFSVNWAGRTSHPGCGGARQAVGPGTYQLVGKLGPLTSGPAQFTLAK